MRILKSTYPKQITIKRSDATTINLLFPLKAQKMKAILETFENQDRDSADYTLQAKFRLKLPVTGKREFDVNTTMTPSKLQQKREHKQLL